MKTTTRIIIGILLFSLVLSFSGCNTGRDKNSGVAEATGLFQTLLDSVVAANDSVAGIILHIESPQLNISWTGTAGSDKVNGQTKLKVNQPFRMASITKTYVATTILMLAEKKLLSLDDPIDRYISPEHTKMLSEDGYQNDKISIRNLLTHTHGIYDYAMADVYFQKIKENPDRVWTRTEQLEIATKYGNPLGQPNTQFYYSDSGYILLGEIIESITGKSLAKSLRELIDFNSLGLHSTWTEWIEETPHGLPNIVHPYYLGTDFYTIHPSIDLYGGGGLVATASDLALFFQALFENEIFANESTLELMLTKIELLNGEEASQDYRMGIQLAEINGYQIYYHSGIWGSLAAYVPKLNSSVVVNFTNQYDPEIIVKSVSLLDKLYKEKTVN